TTFTTTSWSACRRCYRLALSFPRRPLPAIRFSSVRLTVISTQFSKQVFIWIAPFFVLPDSPPRGSAFVLSVHGELSFSSARGARAPCFFRWRFWPAVLRSALLTTCTLPVKRIGLGPSNGPACASVEFRPRQRTESAGPPQSAYPEQKRAPSAARENMSVPAEIRSRKVRRTARCRVASLGRRAPTRETGRAG